MLIKIVASARNDQWGFLSGNTGSSMLCTLSENILTYRGVGNRTFLTDEAMSPAIMACVENIKSAIIVVALTLLAAHAFLIFTGFFHESDVFQL